MTSLTDDVIDWPFQNNILGYATGPELPQYGKLVYCAKRVYYTVQYSTVHAVACASQFITGKYPDGVVMATLAYSRQCA